MRNKITMQQDEKINLLRLTFEAISVYRKILNNKVINKLYSLVDCIYRGEQDLCGFISCYNDFYNTLSENSSNLSLKEFLAEYILYNENMFSRKAELEKLEDIDINLIDAVKRDLDYLLEIASVPSAFFKSYFLQKLCKSDFEVELVRNLPEWNVKPVDYAGSESCVIIRILADSSSWSDCIAQLAKFYNENSTGIFARFSGFVWEVRGDLKQLKGIESHDPIRFKDLIGYEYERSQIISNTVHFLKGYPANNVLLYGDRGTGKSSTVKALLNEYYNEGLKMIEISRRNLSDIPDIIRLVKGKNLHFIFFIDDLAFEDNEENYTTLKAILEGGLEVRPQNVLIYATSNRRHLIKEKFSDRAGISSVNAEDEVRAMDTMQEKLSLADRFGITVTFSTPDQRRYLDIVTALAVQRNLDIDQDTLKREALQWEMSYNGRSPRTARQFVDWLDGRLKTCK